ncbi:uncharacterized protein BYT42DRAFT_545210 [Radiomyces spectabilis]|uniref:uncharacterized protein n=1 Tax=Radiomyces spectabilis TaxID=64574 RepID=UPI0022203B70|nr:uncharacterized protein BYT42DRAFT_545210 [Radiomyces spectabilis]KAI8381297.1 hypothetical protein BYT42DRAFT_545210 [Radiomyces spectabilis]
MMWPKRRLSIQLLEPILFLGANQEAAPVLRGNVIVHSHRSCTLKKLSLRFDGQLTTQSVENINDIRLKKDCQKSVAQQDLVLHPSSARSAAPLLLHVGTTCFAFEMQLPEGLPESIDCQQAKVRYNLTASMTYRSTSSLSDTSEDCTQAVQLARLPFEGSLTGDNYSDTIDSRKHYASCCQYHVIIDSKAVALGDNLPISIRIAPIVQNMRIKNVYLQLLERRQVLNREEVMKTSQSCHLLHPSKDASSIASSPLPTDDLDKPWQATMYYKIPRDADGLVHSTSTYPEFSVSHLLFVSMLVSFPALTQNNNIRRVQHTITFQTPIDLLSRNIGQLGDKDYVKLPLYGDCKSAGERIDMFDNSIHADHPPAYDDVVMTA